MPTLGYDGLNASLAAAVQGQPQGPQPRREGLGGLTSEELISLGHGDYHPLLENPLINDLINAARLRYDPKSDIYGASYFEGRGTQAPSRAIQENRRADYRDLVGSRHNRLMALVENRPDEPFYAIADEDLTEKERRQAEQFRRLKSGNLPTVEINGRMVQIAPLSIADDIRSVIQAR